MKKALSLILAAIMVLSLVACGGKNDTANTGKTNDTNKTETQKPESGKAQQSTDSGKKDEAVAEGAKLKERVVIGHGSLISRYDPQSNNTSVNQHIYELTHNTLIGKNFETGGFDPELAESWEVDGLTYTFKLRQGVTFFEGQKFTAKDVKFTYERAAGTSYQKPKVQDIESMEIVDDYTLKITLSTPNYDFLDLLSSPNMSILCSETCKAFDLETQAEDNGTSNGTGTFHGTEFVPGEYILLTRNENYWGELPPTKEIKYVKYSEASARVIALQTGEIDFCLDIPAIEVPHVESAENCDMLVLPSAKLVYLALNVNGTNPALQDQRVRQALNYATDTASLIAVLTEGYASEAHGTIPPTDPWYYDGVQAYEYNPEKAKELLTEAGYGNGLDVSLSYNKSIYPGLFELLQGLWAQCGINLTLNTDDATVLSDQTAAGTYDITVAQMSHSGTAANTFRSLWYTGSGSNRTLTADPELDAIIDSISACTDEASAREKVAEFSQWVTDHGGIIPLYIDALLYGANKNATGYVFQASGRHDWKYVAVAE